MTGGAEVAPLRCPLDGEPLRSMTRGLDEPSRFVHQDGTRHGDIWSMLDRRVVVDVAALNASVLAIAEAVRPAVVAAARAFADFQRAIQPAIDQLTDAGIIPKPLPRDAMARALELRHGRGTGPARPRRVPPRQLPPGRRR